MRVLYTVPSVFFDKQGHRHHSDRVPAIITSLLSIDVGRRQASRFAAAPRIVLVLLHLDYTVRQGNVARPGQYRGIELNGIELNVVRRRPPCRQPPCRSRYNGLVFLSNENEPPDEGGPFFLRIRSNKTRNSYE